MSNIAFAKNAIGKVSTYKAPVANNNAVKAATPKPNGIFCPTGQQMNWQDIREELNRIGFELNAERIRKKMTKREIARRSHMSPKTVGYVLKGWTQNIYKYIEVANALGLQFTLPTNNQVY